MKAHPEYHVELASKKVLDLYKQTKGSKIKKPGTNSKFWNGGSESFMFNSMEQIATSEDPRTPILNCGIPDPLNPKHVGQSYLPSRVNWVVQSSGVDYLHILLVSMKYLTRRLNITVRFVISIHDEVRFMVHQKNRFLAALALQISNLWVRCFFSHRLGIYDLPMVILHCLIRRTSPFFQI